MFYTKQMRNKRKRGGTNTVKVPDRTTGSKSALNARDRILKAKIQI